MIVRTAVAVLVLTAAVTAAQDRKLNTLTDQEIRDGWLLLFDGETTFGWATTGEAFVKDGKLMVGATKPGTASTGILPAGTMRGLGVDFKKGEGAFAILNQVNLDPAGGYSHAFKPADMTPLFNGKDLKGWKPFNGDPKRAASKFEVTADSELKVSSGPGDLQTEGKYKNFCLQFECKTNGDALNSGIFFRCRENEYQQGYEAQIQNAITNGDRTKPVDFGTGAVYRRVKARKVVSNDKEWFTMTVLAVGANIRTWVNGYPVVDWVDDRKPADNARNGLYEKPGHLSIQGHDPTTDILFRNIRIVEMR